MENLIQELNKKLASVCHDYLNGVNSVTGIGLDDEESEPSEMDMLRDSYWLSWRKAAENCMA